MVNCHTVFFYYTDVQQVTQLTPESFEIGARGGRAAASLMFIHKGRSVFPKIRYAICERLDVVMSSQWSEITRLPQRALRSPYRLKHRFI